MRKVLGIPVFRRFLGVSVFNELAISIGVVALSLLVYRRTGSAIGAMAFFLCAQFVPAFISPLLVARLDQRSSRRVLGALFALEGLGFVLLALLLNRLSTALILTLVLLDGSLGVTARVLSRAVWTSVTGRSGLIREANALINASLSLCILLGPALGGALVAIGGTRAAMIVNAGTFVLITLIVTTAHGIPAASADRVPAAGRLRAAIRYAREEASIRRLLGLEALGVFFFTISIPVEVVFAERSFHAGAGGYGILVSAWGGGAIIGSAIYAQWRRRPSRGLLTIGSVWLGFGFLIMAVAPTLALAITGAAIAGVGNGVQVVAMRTALQEAVPDRWMALILSLNESMFQAVPGAGILVGGALTAVAGPRPALAAGAAGSLFVAVLMWFRLRPAVLSDTTHQPVRSGAAETSAGTPVAARRP